MKKTKPRQSVKIGQTNGRDARGKFTTGNPGRVPGSLNQTRASVKAFVLSKINELPKIWKGLENDKERADFFVRLLPYCISRLQSVFVDEEMTVPFVPTEPTHGIDLKKISDEGLKKMLAILEEENIEPKIKTNEYQT